MISEVVPDPMEGEQTWPTEEELQEAEGIKYKDFLKPFILLAAHRETAHSNKDKINKTVPKGTSDYQASWIVDSEDEKEEEEEMVEQVEALLPLQDDSDDETDSVVSE